MILLRNEFRPKRYAAFAVIRRYGKSARWSQFWSPSGDLGFPTGHNSSLTPNASSSLRTSQFIQHPCAVHVLLGMIEKHFLSEKSTSNYNCKYSSGEKYVCKIFYWNQSTFFCGSNLLKFVYIYIYILHLLFLIASVKCYFDMESQVRKNILKLELEQKIKYESLFTNKIF